MNVLNILYPERCPLCDRAVKKTETGVCSVCEENIKYVSNVDEPVPFGKYYDGGRCLIPYSIGQKSIYRFKYMNRAPYAKMYAKLAQKELGEWISVISPDALVPVPLNRKRLIKRGYNQAIEFALELSAINRIPVRQNLVIRGRNTVAMKYLTKEERRVNLQKAFLMGENVVNLKRVLILDDIFTTGSTINSISKELKAAGVKEVYYLAICRAGI